MDTRKLKQAIRGTVVTVFDPNFAAAHDALVWNGRKPPRRARIIVRARNAEDVATAVRFAAAEGLTVSARGGGHQFSGLAMRGDVVVDLAALNDLRIDADSRIAEVGPGVTNQQLAAETGRRALAFPTGHCGSVPVSGYLLGGGLGWNAGSWGIACFSVEAAEVVMADGRILNASASEHPEVFWALRGAGPEFFGIVTRYRLRLQPAPGAILCAVRAYPGGLASGVADWVEAAAATAAAGLEVTLKVVPTPDGPLVVVIATAFAGSPVEARAMLDRFGAAAPGGAVETVPGLPASFETLYAMTGASTPAGQRYAVDAIWSDAPLAAALARAVAAIGGAPTAQAMAIFSLRPRGAAPIGDAAFSRIGRLFCALYAVWQDEVQDVVNLGWLRGNMRSFAPLATGAYVGEADLEPGGSAQPIHSEPARARLAELQARHDPERRFLPRLRAAIAAQ